MRCTVLFVCLLLFVCLCTLIYNRVILILHLMLGPFGNLHLALLGLLHLYLFFFYSNQPHGEGRRDCPHGRLDADAHTDPGPPRSGPGPWPTGPFVLQPCEPSSVSRPTATIASRIRKWVWKRHGRWCGRRRRRQQRRKRRRIGD